VTTTCEHGHLARSCEMCFYAKRVAELEATEQRFNTFMAAIAALGPHAGKPDAHVEALLDKVRRVGELEAEVQRLRGVCERAAFFAKPILRSINDRLLIARVETLIDDLANEGSKEHGV